MSTGDWGTGKSSCVFTYRQPPRRSKKNVSTSNPLQTRILYFEVEENSRIRRQTFWRVVPLKVASRMKLEKRKGRWLSDGVSLFELWAGSLSVPLLDEGGRGRRARLSEGSSPKAFHANSFRKHTFMGQPSSSNWVHYQCF